jgi:hypothetical protein
MATINGPTPVNFVPPSTAVVINSCTVDMHSWTYTVNYGDPNNQVGMVATGAVPPTMQAGMLANAKMAIELAMGWAPGSSTVG